MNLNTISISRPIPPPDRRLSDAVASIMNVTERIGASWVAKRLPSPELRELISQRLADVRRALLPLERSMAEKQRAARALTLMLGGFNAKADDPAAKVSVYVATLGDLPCWAVEQVCDDVAHGRIEGMDTAFPPSAPWLHQRVEQAIWRLRKEAKDLHAVNSATLEAPVPTEDERKRVGIKLMELKDELNRGPDDEFQARQRVKFKKDAASRALDLARVSAEYAAAGMTPPASPLALSLTCRRDMELRDRTKTM